MNIWPTKHLKLAINISNSQFVELLHEYLASNTAENADKDADVLDGLISDSSFRIWRKFSAGFGQPVLKGDIASDDKKTIVEVDFRVSLLSQAYFWIAFVFAFSFTAGGINQGAYSVPNLVAYAVVFLAAFIPYILIRNGFLYEQRTHEEKLLEFLSANYPVTIDGVRTGPQR